MKQQNNNWFENERIKSNISQDLFESNFIYNEGGYDGYCKAIEWLDVADNKNRRYGNLYDGFMEVLSVDILSGEIKTIQHKPKSPIYKYDRELKKNEQPQNPDDIKYINISGTKLFNLAMKYGLSDLLPKDSKGNIIKNSLSYATEEEKAKFVKGGLLKYIKFKPIKYESKPKTEIPYIFPFLPDKTFKFICEKQGLLIPPDLANFSQKDRWLWLGKFAKKIYISEGAKKACSLLSQGEVAISSFSITTHSKKKKEGAKTSVLKKDIREFLGDRKNHQLIIAFDNDSKPSTRRAVQKQIFTLGKKLKPYGEISVAKWYDSKCKGIDDYLAEYKDMKDIEIISLKELRQNGREYFNRKFSPDVKVHEKYLSSHLAVARKLGKKMLCIKSCQNTGKSTMIQRELENYDPSKIISGEALVGTEVWVPNLSRSGKIEFYDIENDEYCVAIPDKTHIFLFLNFKLDEIEIKQYPGRFPEKLNTFVALHRQSLTTNLAQKFKTGHYQEDYMDGIGMTYCVDSILQEHNYLTYNNMVIDEASQVAWHLLSSNTEIKKQRLNKIDRLGKIGKQVVENNGIISLLDADLDNKTVNFYADLYGINREDIYCVENTYKPFVDRILYTYDDIASLRSQIIEVVHRNQRKPRLNKERIIVHTCGQRATSTHSSQNLRKELINMNVSPDDIIVIDSTTLGDVNHKAYDILANLDYFKKYTYLIASSSINTGVDLTIEKIGKIDKVFGIYYGNYPLNDFEQSLERYRGNADRHVFCTLFSNNRINYQSNNYDDLYKNIIGYTNKIVSTYKIDQAKLAMDMVGHYVQYAISINNDYKNLYDNFVVRAKDKGYNIKQGKSILPDERKRLKKTYKEIKKDSTKKYYADVIRAEDIDELKAKNLELKQRKTYAEQIQLLKYQVKKLYLTEEITEELMALNEDYQKVLNRYYSGIDIDIIKAKDTQYLEYLEKSCSSYYPIDLNHAIKFPLVEMLKQFNIKELVKQINELKFTNEIATSYLESFKQSNMKDFAKNLKQTLKIDLYSEQSGMKFFSGLLNRFGYKLEYKQRARINGKAVRVYEAVSTINSEIYSEIESRWIKRDVEFLENYKNKSNADPLESIIV